MAPKSLLHALVFALAILPIAGRSARAEIKYRGYLPSFPLPAPAEGVGPGGGPGVWMGGDASFMCPLDQTRAYWSFADAGIGPPGTRDRLDPAHRIIGVGNSVAIMTFLNGQATVQHYFRGPADHPTPFFADPNNPNNEKGTRLWLRKPLMHKGKLYIFAHQILDPGAVYNTLLIRVANPLDPPPAWNYDYLYVGILPAPPVGREDLMPSPPFMFGVAAFVDAEGGFLYTYGSIVNNTDRKSAYEYFHTFQVSALRIPLDRVESAPAGTDLSKTSEFMTGRFGEWKPGLFEPDNYYRVGIPSINGYSVRYNATLKAWQAVFCHDGAIADYHGGGIKFDDPKANSVFLMTGKTAYGPWSPPVAVARVPEMNPAEARLPDRPQGPNSWFYAVTEQPAFETWDGDVVFVYTIGSLADMRERDQGPKLRDLRLYTVYAWSAAHPSFGPREPAANAP